MNELYTLYGDILKVQQTEQTPGCFYINGQAVFFNVVRHAFGAIATTFPSSTVNTNWSRATPP